MTLSEQEKELREWQLNIPGFSEEKQEMLKNAKVLISRVGGLGSPVAYELAAAGVGHLVVAHHGVLNRSDLNRQLLMSSDGVGRPRAAQAAYRLRSFQPDLHIVAVDENISERNAERLVGEVDLVVDCAPLFEERFAMHDEAFKQGKPIIEAAMFGMTATLSTVVPGEGACLRCRVPEIPATWERNFPVFGAVSGSVGCMAAMEAIKVLTGLGEPLVGKELQYDLAKMDFRVVDVPQAPDCPVCSRKGSEHPSLG